MTYDPKTKSIKYTKENDDKEHEIICEPISGEEMYFCVTLNTHDEAVSIVQWKWENDWIKKYFICIYAFHNLINLISLILFQA